jgi:hypothetical protein
MWAAGGTAVRSDKWILNWLWARPKLGHAAAGRCPRGGDGHRGLRLLICQRAEDDRGSRHDGARLFSRAAPRRPAWAGCRFRAIAR